MPQAKHPGAPPLVPLAIIHLITHKVCIECTVDNKNETFYLLVFQKISLPSTGLLFALRTCVNRQLPVPLNIDLLQVERVIKSEFAGEKGEISSDNLD